MGNLWYCSVQEIVPMDILTTKIPSVMYSSLWYMLITTLCLSARDVREEFLISVFFTNTELYKKTRNKILTSSSAGPSKRETKRCSILFIGDEAFLLSANLMKVYPGHHANGSKERIFNYSIYRARRLVENVFGLASSVFRVLPSAFGTRKISAHCNDYCLLTQLLKKRPWFSSNLYSVRHV